MSVVELFAATHDSGSTYKPLTGSLRVGEHARVVGRVSTAWMNTNESNQGCVELRDLDNHNSLKWGSSRYSEADLCGYNKYRTSSEGVDLFVANVYAMPEHVGSGIRIQARCYNPVSGSPRTITIPVVAAGGDVGVGDPCVWNSQWFNHNETTCDGSTLKRCNNGVWMNTYNSPTCTQYDPPNPPSDQPPNPPPVQPPSLPSIPTVPVPGVGDVSALYVFGGAALLIVLYKKFVR